MGVHESMTCDIKQDKQFNTANNRVNRGKGLFNQ